MKKFFLTFTILFCVAVSAFTLPGFTPFVPDTSGEYVYYRDYSFTRESYIGLLNYDDTSYQLRYYAPASRETVQPEKSIALLFSVNPESDFFDMTGEKIISEIDPYGDDVDILNYMHDILYELSSRRIKCDQLAAQEVNESYEYEQFGGRVTICYDSLIPLFNIKTIKDQNSTLLFSCVTFGRIINAQDTSFEDFKGLLTAKPYHAPTVKKVKGKAKKFSTQDGQTITLDSNWEQKMDNLWMYGDEASISIATIPTYFEENDLNNLFILRRVIESTGGSYTDFENLELIKNEKQKLTKILAKVSQPEDNQLVYVIKEITGDANSKVHSYISLAAYEDSYLQKSSYYTKLLKSFKD